CARDTSGSFEYW
nr:immunoglobulin heavy chain junction region [Macaca mulatta]MOW94535.1 immunoglobulin heavy chain junction region [Macaca mulatta]MOW95809.1 immunoglobulin heavy chain junction region [Macaca mulatta]MOW95957.1 immunoglobulin heavy chain junction region [Macaca mulatta]MOW96366.1 immunoglobulin heavy chain junction region [Macaca mulatta]